MRDFLIDTNKYRIYQTAPKRDLQKGFFFLFFSLWGLEKKRLITRKKEKRANHKKISSRNFTEDEDEAHCCTFSREFLFFFFDFK